MSSLQELGRSGLLLGAGIRKELSSGEEVQGQNLAFNCEQALIAEGIGERRCPTSSKWAVYVVGGAIIATLTGRYPSLPEQETSNIEDYTWEALRQAIEENPAKLDPAFTAAILKSFFPRERHSPPSRPYRASSFARHWGILGLRYPDTNSYSVGNVRLERLEEGHKAFDLLPKGVRDSVHQVASRVPTMLEIVNNRIHETHT